MIAFMSKNLTNFISKDKITGFQKKDGNVIVLILSALNTLFTLGVIAVLYLSFIKEKKTPLISADSKDAPLEEEHEKSKSQEEKEGKSSGKKKSDYGKMITLDQFTINLTTTGSSIKKFIRLNITLETLSEEVESEITAKMPQVRNVVIDLFNSKRTSDLVNTEGREYVKEEIKNAINGFLVSGKLTSVFFTNFSLSG